MQITKSLWNTFCLNVKNLNESQNFDNTKAILFPFNFNTYPGSSVFIQFMIIQLILHQSKNIYRYLLWVNLYTVSLNLEIFSYQRVNKEREEE